MQELTFSFTPQETGFIVKQLGTPGNGDSVDYVIHFRPYISQKTANETQLSIFHSNNKICLCKLVVLNKNDEPKRLVIWKNQLEYDLYETHQLKIDVEKDLVESMFVTIEDGPTQLAVNTKQKCIPHILGVPERAIFLNWFPPNIDPAQYGIKIDTREIPQRSPLWFKLRGEVSGTKAYTLLGFFVPSKHVDKDYSFKKPAVFSAESKAIMRLGSACEEYIILCYLHTFPDRVFYEVGWCPLPAGYPHNWGASPDGIITDPTMTWSQINEALPKEDQYTEAEMAKYDITKGACEFKTSQRKTCMEPYFLAQVYMEMMALNVVWCDLVRYRPDDEARIYRVYRSKQLETNLLELWKYAYKNNHRLQDVVMEHPFVEMRDRLKQMASASKAYKVVDINRDSLLVEKFQNYTEYKTSFAKEVEIEEKRETHVERARKIARISVDDQTQKNELIGLIAFQMEEYAQLLKNLQTK